MNLKETPPPTNLRWLRDRWTMIVIGVLLVGLALSASSQLIEVLTREIAPVSVVACDPDSYVPPENIVALPDIYERGPNQGECDRKFRQNNGVVYEGESVRIAGQACNETDDYRIWRIQVRLISVDNPGLEYTILSVPVDYWPGCQEPYDFPFRIPWNQIKTDLGDRDDYGRWRIYGIYVPIDDASRVSYQWTATGSFRLLPAP